MKLDLDKVLILLNLDLNLINYFFNHYFAIPDLLITSGESS